MGWGRRGRPYHFIVTFGLLGELGHVNLGVPRLSVRETFSQRGRGETGKKVKASVRDKGITDNVKMAKACVPRQSGEMRAERRSSNPPHPHQNALPCR